MNIPEIRDILVNEETYKAEMEQKVLPYINQKKTELSLFRNEAEKLYCLSYCPENPAAVAVISHGFTETCDKFAEMVYYFLNMGCAVYVYEHCGHGRSYRLVDDPDKVHVDSYKRYAEDLIFVAQTAKQAYPGLPVYLYGHSMGGGIAACAAAMRADLFDKVILSSPMIRPATGSFPWFVTRAVCWLFSHTKKKYDYAPGQRPYTGDENFEASCASSRARYDYYNEVRRANKDLQMNGATYGWLYAGVKMNIYLQKEGWENIKGPLLLFQAENETLVINSQQELFIKKLQSRGISARLVQIKQTKHEIYRAGNDILSEYLEKIFEFYGN